jgi:hypothetical protein
MKRATLSDRPDGGFDLEYENGRGVKTVMRLDANTYEKAIKEARAFLGTKEDGTDEDGVAWEIDGETA